MSKSVVQPETARTQQAPASSTAPAQVPAAPAAKGPPAAVSNGSAPTKPVNERLSLAELFADEDGSDESPADTADDPTQPPDTVDALVKRLGLTHEQVYAIKVAMPGGAEALTLGQIKDRVGASVDLDQRELQFDQRRIKQEGELLRSQTELRELLSLLPKGSVSQEIVNKLRTRHDSTMTRERELTLEHIDAWRDEKKMTEEVSGIAAWLHDEYGFDKSFVTTIVDHRALKFVRDMFLRDKKIKAALANVTTPTGNGRTPSGRSNTKGGIPRAPGAPGSVSSNRPPTTPTERDRLSSIFNK